MVRSKIGYQNFHQVINRVNKKRALGSGPHTPTQLFWECPQEWFQASSSRFLPLQTSIVRDKSVVFFLYQECTVKKRWNVPHFSFHGMNYLHNSPVKLHGNLASSRCMIHSHLVVSITDWGLHNYKAGQEKVECDVNKMYAGKQLPHPIPSRTRTFSACCLVKRSFNHPGYEMQGRGRAAVSITVKTLAWNICIFKHWTLRQCQHWKSFSEPGREIVRASPKPLNRSRVIPLHERWMINTKCENF